jgi:phenylpyruvate tautomerase PptA (4-oxalocrotonate tautomerase family)
MPLYTLITQDGALSSDAKAKLAMELTTLHSEYSGVQKTWVHVVFQDYAPGSGFTAGEPSATTALTLLIRRSRRGLKQVPKTLYQFPLIFRCPPGPDDQIVIGIQEVPASQAMEMGQVMPDIANE